MRSYSRRAAVSSPSPACCVVEVVERLLLELRPPQPEVCSQRQPTLRAAAGPEKTFEGDDGNDGGPGITIRQRRSQMMHHWARSLAISSSRSGMRPARNASSLKDRNLGPAYAAKLDVPLKCLSSMLASRAEPSSRPCADIREAFLLNATHRAGCRFDCSPTSLAASWR